MGKTLGKADISGDNCRQTVDKFAGAIGKWLQKESQP